MTTTKTKFKIKQNMKRLENGKIQIEFSKHHKCTQVEVRPEMGYRNLDRIFGEVRISKNLTCLAKLSKAYTGERRVFVDSFTI